MPLFYPYFRSFPMVLLEKQHHSPQKERHSGFAALSGPRRNCFSVDSVRDFEYNTEELSLRCVPARKSFPVRQ